MTAKKQRVNFLDSDDETKPLAHDGSWQQQTRINDYFEVYQTLSDHYRFKRTRKRKIDKKDFFQYQRILLKTGQYRTYMQHGIELSEWIPAYLLDIYTTLIELNWMYVISLYCTTYIASWAIFGMYYWIMNYATKSVDFQKKWYTATQEYLNGTLSYHHLNTFEMAHNSCFIYAVDYKKDSYGNEYVNWASVTTLKQDSLLTALQMSMETQTTIGYGPRSPHSCYSVFPAMCLQNILGNLLQTILIGVVVGKINAIGSAKRQIIVQFAERCCIAIRSGIPCLIFRLCTFVDEPLVGVNINVMLCKRRRTDGFVVFKYLDLSDTLGDSILHGWPIQVCHKITEHSPMRNFYTAIRNDAERLNDYELTVTVTGSDYCSGRSLIARTSYTEKEIVWDKKFKSFQIYQSNTDGKLVVDLFNFDDVEEFFDSV